MAELQPQATQGTGPSAPSTIVARKREVLYDTDKDSSAARFARYITCHCCAQRSVITTEQITIKYWGGCTYKEKSLDIDLVKDIQLRETCGPCLMWCGRGDIRIYGQDADQKDQYFTCYNVERAGEVFVKVAELSYKLNDLKFGMSRPDDKTIPFLMYKSSQDPFCLKCLRTTLCGCCRPTTVITKSGISQSSWVGPKRVTKRMDLDRVKDIQITQTCCEMCCDSGTIRIYGTDEDQTDEYFDITWVGQVKTQFDKVNKYWNLLNNRDRVGFHN